MVRKETIILIAIMALGAFFRFYQIADIPPGLYTDEAANGNNALEALTTGNFKIFYPENNGREGLFINLQAVAIAIFGREPWVLRLVSAIFGTLTIFGVYLLAKELFAQKNSKPETLNHKQIQISNDQNSKQISRPFRFWVWDLFRISDLEFRTSRGELVGLFSSFLLATSYWHINFSRIGFRAIMVPFISSFGTYFLLKTLRTGKVLDTTLAGIFIGLGFYTYPAFRFIPFVIAVPITFYLIRWFMSRSQTFALHEYSATKNTISCAPCVIALFIFVAIVVALPLAVHFIKNPDVFFARIGQVSVFVTENPISEFAKSNYLTLQMFFWRGDCNMRHNFSCQPQLFWPVAVFFTVGLIAAAKEFFRSKANKVEFITLLLWLTFMSLPATLTNEGLPHALRSLGMIPAVIILAAFGAVFLEEKVSNYLSSTLTNEKYKNHWVQIRRIKKEAFILIFLVLTLIVFNSYKTYFIDFTEHPDTYLAFSTDLKNAGEYLNTLPAETKKFIVVNNTDVIIRGIPTTAQTPMFITDTFRESERVRKNIKYISSVNEINFTPEEKVVIIPADTGLHRNIHDLFPELKPKVGMGFISFENY